MMNPTKFDGLDPTASLVNAVHSRWPKHHPPPHLRADVQLDLLHYLIEGRHAVRQRSRLSELSRMKPPEPLPTVAAGRSGGTTHCPAGDSIVMGKRSSVQGVIVRVKTCRGGGFEDHNSRCDFQA